MRFCRLSIVTDDIRIASFLKSLRADLSIKICDGVISISCAGGPEKQGLSIDNAMQFSAIAAQYQKAWDLSAVRIEKANESLNKIAKKYWAKGRKVKKAKASARKVAKAKVKKSKAK